MRWKLARGALPLLDPPAWESHPEDELVRVADLSASRMDEHTELYEAFRAKTLPKWVPWGSDPRE